MQQQVTWHPASDGAKDYSGKIIERPHCPLHGEMRWFAHEAEYVCDSCDKTLEEIRAAYSYDNSQEVAE